MASKNETPALVLSLLITLGLLGAGAWWFLRGRSLDSVLPPASSPTDTAQNGEATPPQTLDERLSTGNRILVGADASPQKWAGAQAIAAGDYGRAMASLEASLQAQPNDPEALIYLNNARIGQTKAHTIAVSVPIGPSLNPSLEILRGVAQAQQEVNQAGGMNGVPLRVAIASDDNDPTTVEQVAEKLVADASIVGVIGHFSSDATLAAGPVYEQGQLPMISPTSTSVQVSQLGNYIFRTVPSDRFTANTLAQYLVKTLNRKNAVVFYNSGSNYSQSLKSEFTTVFYTEGGQRLTEVDLTSPTFDAVTSVRQALQQSAEALILLANTATLDQALSVVDANQGQLNLLGGDSLYNIKLLQAGGANARGMVVAVPWILQSNPSSPFVQSSRQLWGGDVNWRTAMAYDATLALIEALRREPAATRSTVAQALQSPDFSVAGATGEVRFLPSGDRNQSMQLVIVEPGPRSGYGYDFVPAQ